MRNVSRRIVMLSVGLAAAGGLVFSAALERAGVPDLALPVDLSQQEDGDQPAVAVVDPPVVPSEPVPVKPRVQRRDDDVRPGDDDDDGTGDDDGRDDDDGADGPRAETDDGAPGGDREDRRAPRGDNGDDETDDAGGDGDDSDDSDEGGGDDSEEDDD